MADEFYLVFQKVNDLYKAKVAEWEKHFDWLEEVVRLSKEAQGQPILPKTPAARGRKRKVLPLEPSVEDDQAKGEPPTPAVASTAAQVETEMEKSNQEDDADALSVQKSRGVDRSSATSKDSGVYEDDIKKSSHGVQKKRTRSLQQVEEEASTSENGETDAKAPSASNKLVIPVVSVKAPPPSATNGVNEGLEDVQPTNSPQTKKEFLKEEIPEKATLQVPPPQFPAPKEIGVRHLEVKLATVNEQEKCPVRVTRTKKRAKEESSEEELVSLPVRSTRSKKPKPEQVEEKVPSDFEVKSDPSDAEELRLSLSESSEAESNSPKVVREPSPPKDIFPIRITRSKVKKLVEKESESPAKKSPLPNLALQHGRSPHSPAFKKNAVKRINEVSEVSCQVEDLSVSSVQVHLSPVKVIKHSDSAVKGSTVKKLKPTLSYQTPSPSQGMNRHKLLTKAISANKYSQHRPNVGPSAAFSPQYKMVRTPSDLSRPSNLVSSMSSFVTRVQPSKPSREEIEEKREREIRLKREREEESKRKKAELMKQRMEEQKRKNEERMKRVQEKREAKERAAEEARAQQERERKLRDEKQREFREKEEKERRKKLMEAKKQEELLRKQKEEEEARMERARKEEEEAAKMKQRLYFEKLERARREEEEAARLEKLRREEEQRKLLQKNLKLEQKRAKEKAALELYEQQERNRILREKQELAQVNAREAQRKSSNEETQKENAPLNSTFTKPAQQVTSYQMTPAPLPQPYNPNNYDIHDIRSDDSTDEDSKPKKSIPKWAQGNELKKLIMMQFSSWSPSKLRLQDTLSPSYLKDGKINIDKIFPPSELLKKDVELSAIFVKQRPNFHTRGSSAQWHTPPYKFFNCEGAADSFICP